MPTFLMVASHREMVPDNSEYFQGWEVMDNILDENGLTHLTDVSYEISGAVPGVQGHFIIKVSGSDEEYCDMSRQPKLSDKDAYIFEEEIGLIRMHRILNQIEFTDNDAHIREEITRIVLEERGITVNIDSADICAVQTVERNRVLYRFSGYWSYPNGFDPLIAMKTVGDLKEWQEEDEDAEDFPYHTVDWDFGEPDNSGNSMVVRTIIDNVTTDSHHKEWTINGQGEIINLEEYSTNAVGKRY